MKVDDVKIGMMVARMVDAVVLSGIVKEINDNTVVFTTDDGEDIQSSVGKLLGLIVGGE